MYKSNNFLTKSIMLFAAALLGFTGVATITPNAADTTTPTTVQAAQTFPYKLTPVDEAGHKIGDTVTGTAPIGYTVPMPSIPGYKIIEGQNLQIDDKLLRGNIVYKEIANSNLKINYIDQAGNTLETTTITDLQYDAKGNIDLKTDLGAQYIFDQVKSNNDNFEVTSDGTTLTYSNKNEAGGDVTVDVLYNAKAATVTLNYVDANGNTISTKDISNDDLYVGADYNYTLEDKITGDDNKTYSFANKWTANDNTTGTDTNVALTLSADTVITATYTEDQVAPSTDTNYYLPGVYANASAGVALDPDHYTIVSAGSGVGILGATSYGQVQFTGLFGNAWKIGTRVYVGPFGVWVIAGITPDKKVVVTPLSANAQSSAAVAGITTALAAGSTANASLTNGVGAGAAAGITTAKNTEQVAVGVGNVEDKPSGEIASSSDDNIIDNITNGTIKAVNGIVGGIAKTVNKVFSWLF
ncbi:MucBP domain-containing protein [Agrilactobacillus yilanensis]|uniref:MucBP domain-containing protein n=1 Tax=Agrilactobacillus yilanensis TaxID=2485997 RepID=A0ABW4J9V2_9LACO|nr:MucBP domain-containing protein [Agrilactobacillus yilanensis]